MSISAVSGKVVQLLNLAASDEEPTALDAPQGPPRGPHRCRDGSMTPRRAGKQGTTMPVVPKGPSVPPMTPSRPVERRRPAPRRRKRPISILDAAGGIAVGGGNWALPSAQHLARHGVDWAGARPVERARPGRVTVPTASRRYGKPHAASARARGGLLAKINCPVGDVGSVAGILHHPAVAACRSPSDVVASAKAGRPPARQGHLDRDRETPSPAAASAGQRPPPWRTPRRRRRWSSLAEPGGRRLPCPAKRASSSPRKRGP